MSDKIHSPIYVRRIRKSSSPPASHSELPSIQTHTPIGTSAYDSRRSVTTDSERMDTSIKKHQEISRDRLQLTGLRQRRLVLLITWLALLGFLALFMLLCNISLVVVLQMSSRGMQALRIYNINSFKNKQKQGVNEELIVQFSAQRIHLGHLVIVSGKLFGQQSRPLTIRGPKVNIMSTENSTRASLQPNLCRIENADKFEVINGKSLRPIFKVQNPHIEVAKGQIKQMSSHQIITNKVRSTVDEDLDISSGNISIRGNERIRTDSMEFVMSSKSGPIWLKTSMDGLIRFSASRIILGGGKNMSDLNLLPISTSPALAASLEAFRVCLCRSTTSIPRPKLFFVPGSRQCHSSFTTCP